MPVLPKRESNVHFESNCKTRRFDRPHRRRRQFRVAVRRQFLLTLRRQFLRPLRRQQRTAPRTPAIRAPPHRPAILNRIRIHAPPGNPPHQAGASILARPAIPLVERARPELAPPLRTKTHRRLFHRRSAALRIRHQYLPGLRPLHRQRAFAGRAARPLFPLLRAGRRRCLRRESRHGSGAARRTQQSHRKFNRRRSVQSLDRRQSGRLRPLRS